MSVNKDIVFWGAAMAIIIYAVSYAMTAPEGAKLQTEITEAKFQKLILIKPFDTITPFDTIMYEIGEYPSGGLFGKRIVDQNECSYCEEVKIHIIE